MAITDHGGMHGSSSCSSYWYRRLWLTII